MLRPSDYLRSHVLSRDLKNALNRSADIIGPNKIRFNGESMSLRTFVTRYSNPAALREALGKIEPEPPRPRINREEPNGKSVSETAPQWLTTLWPGIVGKPSLCAIAATRLMMKNGRIIFKCARTGTMRAPSVADFMREYPDIAALESAIDEMRFGLLPLDATR